MKFCIFVQVFLVHISVLSLTSYNMRLAAIPKWKDINYNAFELERFIHRHFPSSSSTSSSIVSFIVVHCFEILLFFAVNLIPKTKMCNYCKNVTGFAQAHSTCSRAHISPNENPKERQKKTHTHIVFHTIQLDIPFAPIQFTCHAWYSMRRVLHVQHSVCLHGAFEQ